jgi:hypothetical protein
MGYEVFADENIIYIVNEVIQTIKDYMDQTVKAMELAKEHEIHLFLSDNTKATNIAKLIELFNLPEMYEKGKANRMNRLAVITPKSNYDIENYEFFETICRNRAWNVKLFRDKQNAIEWLLSD